MEDEEDIFVGDTVSCKVKIVHENLIPAGATLEDVLNGTLPEEDETEESEKEVEEVEEEKETPKEMMTAEEFNSLLDETPVEPAIEFEPGVVYSKK